MMNWLDEMQKVLNEATGNYDARMVVPKTKVEGFTVSTASTPDHGLETAIINTRGQAYPVERYKTKAEAKEGHKHWCRFLRAGGRHITRLGGWEGVIPDETATLI